MSSGESVELYQRRGLKTAICAIACEANYTDAEDTALETLTEMLQSFLTELTRSTKAYCELTGRTEPLVTDVVVALTEMGQNVNDLPFYARRLNAMRIQPPSGASANSELKCLRVGVKMPLKSNISDAMPPFPDPHTYIKSSMQKEPCSEYKVIREMAAAQKRDSERALPRFLAKTGYTDNIFSDDPYAFPLIANVRKPLAYMEAFMLRDLEQEGYLDEDDKDKTNQQLRSGTGPDADTKIKLGWQDSTVSDVGASLPGTFKSDLDGAQLVDNIDADSLIDNPYLRTIKMP